MKSLFVLIFFMANLSYTFSQNLGEIVVNEHFSATCEFDYDIKNIFISNNQLIETIKNKDGIQQQVTTRLYDYVIDGNIVIFSSYRELPQKSVTIKLNNGETWYGTLKYDVNDKKIYYPYKSIDNTNSGNIKSIQDTISLLKKRLNYLLTSKTGFKEFGLNKNRIYWQVSNIMADDNYTYLKIIVKNNSGHEYKIANGKPIFKYEEGKNRNINKKASMIEKDALIIYHDSKESINAYSYEILGYVIESYPLNTKGKLIISFIEYNGKRNYNIKIPFRYLSKVEVFND